MIQNLLERRKLSISSVKTTNLYWFSQRLVGSMTPLWKLIGFKEPIESILTPHLTRAAMMSVKKEKKMDDTSFSTPLQFDAELCFSFEVSNFFNPFWFNRMRTFLLCSAFNLILIHVDKWYLDHAVKRKDWVKVKKLNISLFPPLF